MIVVCTCSTVGRATAMQRSLDSGATWGPLTAVVNHGNASFMNPSAIWNEKTKSVLLQFTYIQVCELP